MIYWKAYHMRPPGYYKISIISFVIYLNYIILQPYLEPPKIIERSIKHIYQLPNWLPFRRLTMAMVNNDKVRKSIDRIRCFFAEIFCIGILALNIIALVYVINRPEIVNQESLTYPPSGG